MRLKKFQKRLKQMQIPVAIILNINSINPNVLYLCGYRGHGALIVPCNKKPFIIAGRRDYEKATKTHITAYKCENKLFDFLAQILRRKRLISKKTGLDMAHLSLLNFTKLKKSVKAQYYDVSETCSELRMFKDDTEIRYIKKACSVTDKVFSRIVDNFNFKHENELKLFIEIEIKKKGCELAFPPIVASGKSGSNPHYDESGRIKSGFLILDFGAKYKDYCSDMTRTMYVGKPNIKEKRLYNLVKQIQEDCIKNIKENIEYSELANLAWNSFGKYKKYFIHGLGHGLGLEIHELPNINEEERRKLKNHTVFTIEPGLYFKNRFGIRIEDTILMSKRAITLTRSSKKLLVV
ncbi:aminopeptidase P family protein [Candidatus Woesearchaeota archaeon]|nr:aminopeptidase P family protein [Candidatus Woesearchaeota archaeon]